MSNSTFSNFIIMGTAKIAAVSMDVGSEACLAAAVQKGATGAVQLYQGDRLAAVKNLGLATIFLAGNLSLRLSRDVAQWVVDDKWKTLGFKDSDNQPANQTDKRNLLRTFYIPLILLYNARNLSK